MHAVPYHAPAYDKASFKLSSSRPVRLAFSAGKRNRTIYGKLTSYILTGALAGRTIYTNV